MMDTAQKRVVPVVVYMDGRRQVVGEAVVEVDPEELSFNVLKAEINLNNAGLSETLSGYSLDKSSFKTRS